MRRLVCGLLRRAAQRQRNPLTIALAPMWRRRQASEDDTRRALAGAESSSAPPSELSWSGQAERRHSAGVTPPLTRRELVEKAVAFMTFFDRQVATALPAAAASRVAS